MERYLASQQVHGRRINRKKLFFSRFNFEKTPQQQLEAPNKEWLMVCYSDDAEMAIYFESELTSALWFFRANLMSMLHEFEMKIGEVMERVQITRNLFNFLVEHCWMLFHMRTLHRVVDEKAVTLVDEIQKFYEKDQHLITEVQQLLLHWTEHYNRSIFLERYLHSGWDFPPPPPSPSRAICAPKVNLPTAKNGNEDE